MTSFAKMLATALFGTVIAGAAIPRFLDPEGREIVLPRLSYSHF